MMLHVTRCVILALLLWLSAVSGLNATSFDLDPTAERARSVVKEWSVGLVTTAAATTELRTVVESSANTGGRAYALRCLAWIDIYSAEVDLRQLMTALVSRRDVPYPVMIEARTLEWELRALGQNLGEVAQRALLRSVMSGRPRGRDVDDSSRRWAAYELCARGGYDEEVHRALVVTLKAFAPAESSICKRQRRLLEGLDDVEALEAALGVGDRSHSQAFRVRMIEAAVSFQGAGEERVARWAMRQVGDGEPAAILGTRDLVFDLSEKGATWDDLWKRGVSGEMLSLLVRSGALKR